MRSLKLCSHDLRRDREPRNGCVGLLSEPDHLGRREDLTCAVEGRCGIQPHGEIGLHQVQEGGVEVRLRISFKNEVFAGDPKGYEIESIEKDWGVRRGSRTVAGPGG
jgi:hypothetical protein